MTARARVIKLSVFLTVGLLLVLAMFFLFSRSSIWQTRDRYYVRVDGTAFGVQPGSVVLVRGVRAGTITRIEATTREFSGAILFLDIDPTIRIERGDRAYLQIKGFLGEKQLDIYGGVPGGIALKPGSYIPQGKTLVDQLSDRALALATAANQVVMTTNHLLANLTSLTNAVSGETVHDIMNQLRKTLSGFEAAGGQLDAMLAENRAPLHRATAGASRVLEDAQGAVQQFRVTGERIDEILSHMNRATQGLEDIVRNNGNQLEEILRHLNQAAANVDALTRELREQPSRIFFGQPPKERELP
jgi:phospholipid/cholesterol/gamma-HCH transport system substrate-binding protein